MAVKVSNKTAKSKRAKFIAKGKTADILIYDDIGEDWYGGGISAKHFADDLKALGAVNTLNVYINSYGGCVFEGLTIYNLLARHEAKVNTIIDGLAASIASVIAMAGDHISIAENGMMMIHEPTGGGIFYGSAEELRNDVGNVADALEKIAEIIVDTYVARSGADKKTVSGLVDAETWLTSGETLRLGLADAVTEAKKMAAYVDMERYGYKNAPAHLSSAIYTVKPDGQRAGDAPNRKRYEKIIDFQRSIIKS